MRIESDFKDYYDTIGRQYYDPTDRNVWRRFNADVTFRYRQLRSGIFRRISGRFDIIGFVGNFYLAYQANSLTPVVYDTSVILDVVGQHHTKFGMRYVEEYFDKLRQPDIAIFRELRTPVIYIQPDNGDGYTNPILRNFEFQRCRDPFTAWQELEGFYHTHLVTTDDAAMTRISDEDMARAKGFTHPYSFKKEPKRGH